MVNHEYFLIGYRTANHTYKILDRAVEQNLRIAKKTFAYRNNFKNLLRKYNLTFVEARGWLE
jgi:hypothetical protein